MVMENQFFFVNFIGTIIYCTELVYYTYSSDLTALLHYYITGQIVPICLTSKVATVVALSLLLHDIPTLLQVTSGVCVCV